MPLYSGWVLFLFWVRLWEPSCRHGLACSLNWVELWIPRPSWLQTGLQGSRGAHMIFLKYVWIVGPDWRGSCCVKQCRQKVFVNSAHSSRSTPGQLNTFKMWQNLDRISLLCHFKQLTITGLSYDSAKHLISNPFDSGKSAFFHKPCIYLKP